MANKTLSNSGIVNLSNKDYFDVIDKLVEKHNGSAAFVNIDFNSVFSKSHNVKYSIFKYTDGKLKQISLNDDEYMYEYIVLYDEVNNDVFVGYMCVTSFKFKVISLDVMLKVKTLSEAIRVIKLDLIGNDINHTLDGIFRELQDNNDVTISDSGDAFDTCELIEC
jgi:hypothetical protein